MNDPAAQTGARAPLMLSVSGARGIVGESMTPSVACDFAAAFGSFIRERTGDPAPLIVLGRDSRPSGEMLSQAARAGLVSAGCRVVEVGVQMTPTVGVMIDEIDAAGGVVITASHNPVMWNGLKCLGPDGAAPPPRDAQEIIRRFKGGDFDRVDVNATAEIEHNEAAVDVHVNRVLEHVPAEPIRAAGLKVVLDSVNGAGCIGGRVLLDSLGVQCVHINGEPHGRFAHEPEPVRDNLAELRETVVQEDAACGFAQDPDGDRLAVVDNRGRYIGEEYTLVLCAKCVLDARFRDANGSSPDTRYLAANLSTSRMIDDVAARYPNVEVLRTPVGEANVVAAMNRAGSRVLLGGEGNGGVIFPPVCFVRDSLSAMALVLSLIAHERRPLHEIVDDLPHYAMIKQKMDLTSVGGSDAVPEILSRVKARFTDARIDESDGVRVDFEDGWVHLRPSNTEPIVRLIAEAAGEEQAVRLASDVRAAAGVA